MENKFNEALKSFIRDIVAEELSKLSIISKKNIDKSICPNCNSTKIQIERRPDGFHNCLDCNYKWKNNEK